MTIADLPETIARTGDATGFVVSVSDLRLLTADQRWTWVAWLRTRGALAEAAAWIDAIEAATGPSNRVQEERAAVLLAADRPDDAVDILRERARERPSATASVRLATALIAAGRADEAQAISARLLETSGDLKSVQGLAIAVAHAVGDSAALREHYQAEIAAGRNVAAAHLQLATVLLDEGDAAGARDHFERAKQQRASGDGMPVRVAATVAERLGEPELAADLSAEFERLSLSGRRQRDRAVAAALLERLGREVPDELPAPVVSALPEGWPETAAAPTTVEPAGPGDDELDDIELAPVGEPDDLRDRHPEVYRILREMFGYPDLRPGQATIINNVLEGRDTLAIMPTGAGKSLTFQIPSMLLPGVTLVLSPLIALMKDQVESLPPAIRERTTLINSSLTADERRAAQDGIVDGRFKLVYAAPERLRQWSFVHALRQAGTSLVVIDEAHCISMWGHDFRPDYLQIPQVLPALGNPPVLAMTATATRRMGTEIATALGRELDLLTVNLFRPNLYLSAIECANREEKVRRALEIAQRETGSGIVYVGSRADADQIANSLRQRGVSALAYHAGLDMETRSRNQQQFMDGRARVICATVAFGMGVNKSDVRFIIHLAPSRSLEAYAQESGRAGRDGRAARCVLLYTAYDAGNLSRQSSRDQIPIPVLRRVYLNLRAAGVDRWAIVDPRDLLPAGSRDTDDNPIDADIDPRVALGILAQAGLIRRHPDAPIAFSLQPHAGYRTESADGKPSTWREYVRWAWDGPRLAGGSLTTVDACNGLGITPTELTEALESEPGLTTHEGQRMVCLELLPAGPDVRGRMATVLQRGQSEAIRRVGQMMDYAAGTRCRHVALAAHLGQKIANCETACDVCTGNRSTDRPEKTGGRRVWTTAADALEVLEGVRSLPFPMGKTGLSRLLAGSVESSVRDDRSASFGALRDVSPRKIGALIDQLVDEGFLHRDMRHEYKLISLTAAGGRATLPALVAAGHPEAPGHPAATSPGRRAR